MSSTPGHSPLSVSVVGAGIGGLTAALALQRNGHRVQVFESVEAKAEIGAGIGLQINALRVLHHLGIDKQRLRGSSYDGMTIYDAMTGVGVPRKWLLPDMGANQNILCHRNDIHNELVRCALDAGVVLRQGSQVVDCDPQSGTVTLKNGEVVSADVVIGADGLRSTLRSKILGESIRAPVSGLSCFRGLVPTTKLKDLPAELTEWYTAGLSGLHGVFVEDPRMRMLVFYPCRNGEFINVVALYTDDKQDDRAWSPVASRAELLERFQDVQPKFLSILRLLDEPVLRWQLRALPVLPRWTNGRAALLGDSAHATLPTLGQGAAAAIEEAGALGCLLPLGTTPEEVPKRLAGYQELRKPRGDYINREALEQGIVREKKGLYLRSPETQRMLLGHDAIKAAQEYYEQHFAASVLEKEELHRSREGLVV
ncbi:FAD/NAD(P)-binding domain-containing protein [Mycena chlorophos]|uniref:FAD/NAD(P)-binding domain-containing protein n=1 Tax=Mycena chlorophos TaxID=658473 RepID=A0A8H6TAY8_MYCCL|nr:FAD/NAD(P)-binding domain-containing protein [Mycena chlorophos]